MQQQRFRPSLSHVVILTEEDDRDTPGEEILEMIAEGARVAAGLYR